MILQVLVVRDRAADVYGRPFFDVSVGAAVRGFIDEVNRADSTNMMSKHPEDFDLFSLGEYDDHEGKFTLHDRPRQVAVGKDCVK